MSSVSMSHLGLLHLLKTNSQSLAGVLYDNIDLIYYKIGVINNDMIYEYRYLYQINNTKLIIMDNSYNITNQPFSRLRHSLSTNRVRAAAILGPGQANLCTGDDCLVKDKQSAVY